MCVMRTVYFLQGIGVLLIVLALVMINRGFTGTGGIVEKMTNLTISSPDFAHEGSIPARFTCDADDTPPRLTIEGVPDDAKSLVLIVIDPDVPKELRPDGMFLHWLLFNIPAAAKEIGPTGSIGVSGLNSSGKEGYQGPCPPKAYEPSEHRYFFHLYALDTMLSLEAGASESEVRQAMEGHVVAEAELMGKYRRQ